MGPVISLRGDGIAACCSAYLLSASGFVPRMEPLRDAAQRPVILIGQNAQHLIRDVFQVAGLFAGANPIRRRVVRWGPGAETATLPHAGTVTRESDLLARLWEAVSPGSSKAATLTDAAGDWTLLCARMNGTPSQELHFGSRVAQTSAVRLKAEALPDACWAESVESGWLFLLGLGEGEASLISVGDSADALLSASRSVAEQIDHLSSPTGAFPAYPRIRWPLCEPGEIACGSAALGFDPLCGEGAGNAVRESILATAVLRAVARGTDPAGLLEHYSTRLLLGFLRHLEVCLWFYRNGGTTDFWRSEAELIEKGIAWAQQTLGPEPPARYRLSGFDLEPVESTVPVEGSRS